MKFAALLAATTALSLAAPAFAQTAAPAPVSLASGDNFTAPDGWTLNKSGAMVKLAPPEPNSAVTILDVGVAANGTEAIAKAWAANGTPRVAKLVTPRPGRNGWDERAIADYEIPPNAERAIQAIAFRKDTRWTVVLLDASEAVAEKRGAAVGAVIQSLRPAGYVRESFAARPPHPLDAMRIAAMKSFVTQAMKDLGVPGAGLALISGNQVVYEGGLGVKALGSPAPVDAHTLFMIASNTKGMSTLLLSTLVDEKRLRWDQPVTDVYPAFRLGSDATTRSVLVKHLVCACTGLPRKDLEWIFATSGKTPASDTFRQLAATQPTSGFGEVFQYNNLMATAAGYIGGHLIYPNMELGAAYDRAMTDRIFGPLGMTDTTLSMDQALTRNHASPHAWGIGTVPILGNQDFNHVITPFRPAGGAWSSAHDMARYVQLELTKGVLPSGKRLVSEDALLARRVHNVPTGENQWYGMGLFDDRTWDVSVVHHGGSMAGYKSDIMLIPDVGVGAVILTNADEGQLLLRPTLRRLLELVYDGNPEAAADVAAAAARLKAQNMKDAQRLVIPPDPTAVAALAPHYANADLGSLTVERGVEPTSFRFTSWGTTVATKKEDDGTLSFVSTDPLNSGTPMVVGTKDGKRTLTVRDSQHEYVFVETP